MQDRWVKRSVVWAVLLGAIFCCRLEARAEVPAEPAADRVTLEVVEGGGLRIRAGVAAGILVDEPLWVQLVDERGARAEVAGKYQSVTELDAGATRCTGELRSPHGTRFEFVDVYRRGPAPGSILMERQVVVAAAGAGAADAGFGSRFAVRPFGPAPAADFETFMPGIWYGHNEHVPSGALASDPADRFVIVREDRMPLPLVMVRQRDTGVTLTLVHLDPDGGTCLADSRPQRVIDERVRVASLGIVRSEGPILVGLYYPGTEGERTYLGPRQRGAWAERYHPVRAGATQRYKVLIDVGTQPGFAQAMQHAWRTAYALIRPPVVEADLHGVYAASVDLLAHWSRTTNGAAGLPFRLRLPAGELMAESDINYQMGFVGQQLPLAYHLLRFGLVSRDEAIVAKGEAMVDFWARNAPTPAGLPRTWYDAAPRPQWRRYDTFLRVASDGMAGALRAWDVMGKHGRKRPQWLAFCRGFGDWLVRNQNADGSWFRAYDREGRPADRGLYCTTQPIPFLVDLYTVTGERAYLDAAARAGEWSLANVDGPGAYVGGTPDNPDVLDREAAVLAMQAFLAVHDVTGEPRWLAAAARAAAFAETWVYSWNLPIPADDPAMTYPRGTPTTGFSLIATGHSGADLFMAGAAFSYYRIYLATGDAHFAEVARQLLHDPRHAVDVGGSLGYGRPGLVTEALSLAPPRGRGLNVWLPWVTFSVIDPIVRFEEAYGAADARVLTGDRLDEMRRKDHAFAKTRGLSQIGGSRRSSQ